MSSTGQLRIDQGVISFPGPYDRVVTKYLSLSNPTARPFSFKVMSTAPTRYIVKPVSGIIPPDGVISVSIALQPLIGADGLVTGSELFDPNRQYFVIQSVLLKEGQFKNGKVDQLLKQAPKDKLMEAKLMCEFEEFYLQPVTMSRQSLLQPTEDPNGTVAPSQSIAINVQVNGTNWSLNVAANNVAECVRHSLLPVINIFRNASMGMANDQPLFKPVFLFAVIVLLIGIILFK